MRLVHMFSRQWCWDIFTRIQDNLFMSTWRNAHHGKIIQFFVKRGLTTKPWYRWPFMEMVHSSIGRMNFFAGVGLQRGVSRGTSRIPMLIKYPIAIIPERCMKKKSEPRLSFKNTFCFFKMSPYFLGPLHSHESMHRPEPLSVVRYAPLSTRSSLRWRRGHSPFWLMAPFLGWGSMVKSCKLAHTGGNFRGNKLLKGGSFLANF